MPRPSTWFYPARIGARLTGLFPSALRFPAALLIARTLAPVYARLRNVTESTSTAFILERLLSHLTLIGRTFELRVPVLGRRRLQRALAFGRGVVLLSFHQQLNLVLIRVIHDQGVVPLVLATDPDFLVCGTSLPVRALPAGPEFMLRARTTIREGGLVCAAIDASDLMSRRSVEMESQTGTIQFSDAMIHLASRLQATVIFSSFSMDERRGPVAEFAGPFDPAAMSVEQITQAFKSFVRAKSERSRVTARPADSRRRREREPEGFPS